MHDHESPGSRLLFRWVRLGGQEKTEVILAYSRERERRVRKGILDVSVDTGQLNHSVVKKFKAHCSGEGMSALNVRHGIACK